MKFQMSRLFLLLAATVPTLLISGRAGAVSSPDLSFDRVNPSVNFASNTAEKLNLLAPDNLLAKKDKFKLVIKFKQNATNLGPQKVQVSHPSAVNTFNSLLNEDTLN